VQHAVQFVDGLVVGGLMNGLDAAALIDRDVDDHGAVLHRANHVLGDDDRGGASVEHTGDATPAATVRR